MQFEHLGFLMLALPLAVLAWVLLKQRTNIGHSSLSLFQGITMINFDLIQRILICLAVILTITALAKPYHEETKRTTTFQEGRELIFVLDTSSSMESASDVGQKMVIAKEVLAEFVMSRSEDRVGLLSFADRPQLEWPLCFAEELSGMHDPILNRLEALKPHGGTNIARGLLAALDHSDVLSDKDAKGKAIILVSDGISTIQEEEAAEIISRVEEGGIKLYWIFIKTAEARESLNQYNAQQYESVEAVITASDGKVFKTNPEDIEAAVEEIGRLEANPIATIEEKTTRVYHLRPLLLAALLLFIPAAFVETVKEVS